MTRRPMESLTALTLAVALALFSPATTHAQPATGMSALSQAQTLTDAQKGQVATWMNDHFDTILAGDPASAGGAAQALIMPFTRSNVTASFRFAVQGALETRLRGDLASGAEPAARFAALRMCARVGTTRVLSELESALGNSDPIERSLAVAAFADFFETAREPSGPIRAGALSNMLSALESGLEQEDVPTIASQFVAVLAGADTGGSDLRLNATRAMASGLAANLDNSMPAEMHAVWAVTLTHAVENANEAFVQVQLGPSGVQSGFKDAVVALCDQSLAFVGTARTGADDTTRAILDDLERRATSAKQLVTR